MKKKFSFSKWKGPVIGAAFLMATSAIGPGFLNNTALFTSELLTSFGFVILISVLLDIGAQLNIWRIITTHEQPAQDIANKVVPGLGYFLAAIIAFGGLVFNIGNIAGCGLGLQALTGLSPIYGAIISAIIALSIFWYKKAGQLMDSFTKWLGFIMLGLTIYVAISSQPPLGEALYRTVWPEKIDIAKIVILVGGTVGGYISFAGAHRLLEAGIKGSSSKKEVTRSAVSGILITSFMRFILFLAALGVVWQGVQLSSANPAASVFQSAAGNIGYKVFGIVMWCAAITSVVGASYTSVSFWKTLSPVVNNNYKTVISFFILASAILFISIGNPVQLLVIAGAVNGIILPIALAVILIAAVNTSSKINYQHPVLLQVIGWLVVFVMAYFSTVTIRQTINKLF
jgi:Mn2+/Fe2+ NRAMP family transporter